MAGSMVYRLPVGPVTSPHMKRFIKAMENIQALPFADKRSFGQIGGYHGIPSQFCWHHQYNQHDPRPLRLFLPWHRAYLWWLEQNLQDQLEQVALPWWNWTAVRQIPDTYAQQAIGSLSNPLHSFDMSSVPGAPDRHTTRSSGSPPPLPSSREITALLRVSDWNAFSDQLQDFHDSVHVWTGGDMGSADTAGFDPLFYAHHCYIDLIWARWQQIYGIANIPTALLGTPLVPFHKTVREVLNTQDLGYEYARSTRTIL